MKAGGAAGKADGGGAEGFGDIRGGTLSIKAKKGAVTHTRACLHGVSVCFQLLLSFTNPGTTVVSE